MIDLRVSASLIDVHGTEEIVTGAVGVNQVSFTFDGVWDNLTRTAIFACGDIAKSVLLDVNNVCYVPWEVLDKKNVWKPLVVGVYGTNGDGTIVRPTVYGIISQSVSPGAEMAESGETPTPDIYQQMVSIMQSTVQIAQSVRDDADEGAFTPEISVGTVTTGNAGTSVIIEQTGDVLHPILNFTIPKGDKGNAGVAATIAVGTVTTGAAGSSVEVNNVGTSQAARFNFTIPKGDKGDTGDNTLVDEITGATFHLGMSNGVMFAEEEE